MANRYDLKRLLDKAKSVAKRHDVVVWIIEEYQEPLDWILENDPRADCIHQSDILATVSLDGDICERWDGALWTEYRAVGIRDVRC